MGNVSFQPSKDGKSLVLTPSGRAFIKSEELRILSGKGDDFYKGQAITQMYLRYGVEDGTYEKLGFREANSKYESLYKPSKKHTSSEGGSGHDFLYEIKIWGVMALILFCVWLYQTIHAYFIHLLT